MNLRKIVFLGTPEFAVPTLELLANSRFNPFLVITQPDKPAGRKKKLTLPPVKIKSLELKIPVLQPEDINSEEIIDKLKKLQPDLIITVAYGGFLKKEIRHLPRLGCINLHPSLLPEYRGSAPINYTLFNGENETGNTIFKITAKMDAGPILFQSKTKVGETECFTELYRRLAKIGAKNVLKFLEKIEKENISDFKELPSYRKQDEKEATYSHKIEKNDLPIHWNEKAEKIRNRVRGLAVKPATITVFRDKKIKIIEVEVLAEKSSGKPGEIIEIRKNIGIVVSAADYHILLKKVQPAGKKIMDSFAFSLGARIKIGEKFSDGY